MKTKDGYKIDTRRYNPRIVDVYTPTGKLLIANVTNLQACEAIEYHRKNFPMQTCFMKHVEKEGE